VAIGFTMKKLDTTLALLRAVSLFNAAYIFYYLLNILFLDLQAFLAWKVQEHGIPGSKATVKREELYRLVMAAQQHDVAVALRPVVDGFGGFDGISTIFLQILAASRKLNFNGRLEIVQNVMVNSNPNNKRFFMFAKSRFCFFRMFCAFARYRRQHRLRCSNGSISSLATPTMKLESTFCLVLLTATSYRILEFNAPRLSHTDEGISCAIQWHRHPRGSTIGHNTHHGRGFDSVTSMQSSLGPLSQRKCPKNHETAAADYLRTVAGNL